MCCTDWYSTWNFVIHNPCFWGDCILKFAASAYNYDSSICSKTGMMDYKIPRWISICTSQPMKILHNVELHISQQAPFCWSNIIFQWCWTKIHEDKWNFSFFQYFHQCSKPRRVRWGSGKCTSELYIAFTDADVNSKCDQLQSLVKTCACAEQHWKARYACGDSVS